MSITIEQCDAAIRETFYNMEEGVEYVFTDHWFTETNRIRKEYKYQLIREKKQYVLSRKGDQMFVNNNFVFDFYMKSNLNFTLSIVAAFITRAAIAVGIVGALQHNGIEKLNKDTCDGKLVEIDGKKYKLTAV